MSKLVIADALPMLRCVERDQNSAARLCRGRGVGLRRDAGEPGLAIVCARHLRDGDVPLPDVLPGRLVRIVGEILLAGISDNAQVAECEGVAHVAEAVAAASGRFELWSAKSQAVDFHPWPVVGAGRRGSGGGE